MVPLFLLCALVFTAVKADDKETEALLNEISSTIVTDMVSSLDSDDVMTMDEALRLATAKVQPRLLKLAKMERLTKQEAAVLVSNRVVKDRRLLQALAKRERRRGVSTRSASSFRSYVKNLVYTALVSD